jgi:hypothetical protein
MSPLENMKALVLAVGLLAVVLPGFSMAPDSVLQTPARKVLAETRSAGDTTVVHFLPDSVGSAPAVDSSFNTYTILLSPPEASRATVSIIQTSTIEFQPGVETTYPITPDTLGRWPAPLRIALFPGDFTFVARNEGYRETTSSVRSGKGLGRQFIVPMELLSFEYLQGKREQWSTYKWISAGVCVLAGAATFYLDQHINDLVHEYNNTTSPDVAHELRGKIDTQQTLYSIFSGVAFVALGSTIVSWIVELTYH